MRLRVALCGLMLLFTLTGRTARAQQVAQPRKTLTPEQQEYQHNWREYMDKRSSLQARAKQFFDAEMANHPPTSAREQRHPL